MINKHRRVIYIHIPKCAGKSIRDYFKLSPVGGIHADLNIHKKKIASYDDYFKFTIVRNPWDRLVSWYLYHRKFTNTAARYGGCFKAWVKAGCKTHWTGGFTHSGVSWYDEDPLAYTTWGVYNNEYDFVGRFEHLEEDLKSVKIKTSLNGGKYLKKLNVSNHISYTEYYDKASRDIVHERYGLDIEFFDYRFGE